MPVYGTETQANAFTIYGDSDTLWGKAIVAKARRTSEAWEGPFPSCLGLKCSLRKVRNWSEKQKHPQGEMQHLTSRSKSSNNSFGLTFSPSLGNISIQYFLIIVVKLAVLAPFSTFFSLLFSGSACRSVLHKALRLQSWLLLLMSKDINTSKFSVPEGLQIPPGSQPHTPCLGVAGEH